MSGNIHPNPGPVFPCSVCTGNMTWRGRSVQCCTCSKWVHLKCSLISFSKFKTLGSSHSWSFPPCCVSDSSGNPTPTNTVTFSSDFSSLYTSTVHFGPCGIFSQCSTSAQPLSSNLLSPFRPLRIFSFCALTIAPCSWLSL